jgi:hypothetical protein
MAKQLKLKPFEKLLTVMISGKPVTLEEIDALLGKEIYMYRISTYMWHIKSFANGVVKTLKDGRKATGYQLMNVKEVQDYLDRTGISKSGFQPGQVQKKASTAKLANKVKKLADLNAKPEPKVDLSVKEVQTNESVDLVITEITE